MIMKKHTLKTILASCMIAVTTYVFASDINSGTDDCIEDIKTEISDTEVCEDDVVAEDCGTCWLESEVTWLEKSICGSCWPDVFVAGKKVKQYRKRVWHCPNSSCNWSKTEVIAEWCQRHCGP